MADRLFRVTYTWLDDDGALATSYMDTFDSYQEAVEARDRAPYVLNDVADAWVEVSDWSQHWPCCGHRIGTCACVGDRCPCMEPLTVAMEKLSELEAEGDGKERV